MVFSPNDKPFSILINAFCIHAKLEKEKIVVSLEICLTYVRVFLD